MDVRGTHGRAPSPGHDAIELRSRGGPSTSAAGAVSRTDAARDQQIDRIMNTLLSACRSGSDIDDIMRQRAVVLHDEMHQTDDMVKDVVKRAYGFDDNTAQLHGGTVGLTYGLANIPGDLIGKGIARALGLHEGTPAHDFVSATAAGMTAVAFKAVITRAIGNSLQESKWMQADMDALEPHMQEVMKRRDTFGHRMKQSTLGGVGYNFRNPVTGGISAGIQLADESAPNPNAKGITAGMDTGPYLGNQFTSTVGTAIAGAVSGHYQNKHDNLHGAEFLFGRHDWQERYMALASGRTHSGEGSRLNAMWQHATTPKKWTEGVTALSVLSAIGIETAEAFGLGVPLGLAKMGKNATSRAYIADMVEQGKTALDVLKDPSNRASAEALSQLPNIPSQTVAYFLQGAAGNIATNIAHRVENWLHPHTESSSSSSSNTSTTTEDEAAVSSGARTPSGAPPSPPRFDEASLGDPARTPSGTPPRAATPPSPPRFDEASLGDPARMPSEASESGSSDSASMRSHTSGSLRDIPPPRSEEMRAEGDTHPWWTDFKDIKRTDPKPLEVSPEDTAALEAHIEKKAQELIRQIAQSLPLPESETSSSVGSVTSEASEPPASRSAAEIPLPSGAGSSAASLTSRASVASRASAGAAEIPLPSGAGSSAASLTSRASVASRAASATGIPLPESGEGSSAASTTSEAKK